MDQKPKTVASTSPPPRPRNRWLNRIDTLVDVPNPSIVKIFLMSSFVTFSSGLAFTLEWAYHGKYHTGFQWIIYYALVLIFLPVLISLGLRFLAYSSNHEEEEKGRSIHGPVGKCGNEESENNNCKTLAIVVDSDTKKCNENKTSELKRSVSFPLHSKVRSCRTR